MLDEFRIFVFTCRVICLFLDARDLPFILFRRKTKVGASKTNAVASPLQPTQFQSMFKLNKKYDS